MSGSGETAWVEYLLPIASGTVRGIALIAMYLILALFPTVLGAPGPQVPAAD